MICPSIMRLLPLVCVLVYTGVSNVSGQSVVRYTNLIQTRNKSTNETLNTFCILDYIYDRNLTKLQKRNQFQDVYRLDSEDDGTFCDQHESGQHFPLVIKDKDIENKFVLINYSNDCDINQQINYFSRKSIYGLFFIIGCSVDIENGINITNETLFDNKFTVSLIAATSAKLLSTEPIQLKLFDIDFDDSQLGYGLDYSILCIWLLATFTVSLGAYWSGTVRKNIFVLNTQNAVQPEKPETEHKDEKTGGHVEEEAFIQLSPIVVLGFVCLMALMLLLLYYFFQYLVYVIIVLFALASIASVFACFEPLVVYILPDCLYRPSFLLFSQRFGRIYVYQFILLLCAISLSITWFVFRKESFSWILQDFLGICFSLNMLRTIRLPSFKICVILLYALFFYDIFFVFITPYFTSKGNSVMVDVATGGSGGKSRCGKPGEQIPMIVRIPHQIFQTENSTNPLDVCGAKDSLLGFGDILVPGLLVSYCFAFDLIYDIKCRIYYVVTCVSYGLGLIATFAGLYLMSGSAQPALLYLVPFTTIPPILIALYRKEFKQLWVGPETHTAQIDTTKNRTKQTDSSIEDDNLLINETQDTVSQNK